MQTFGLTKAFNAFVGLDITAVTKTGRFFLKIAGIGSNLKTTESLFTDSFFKK
jgi:hypothetical protein